MNDTDVRCPKCMGTNGHHNTLHTRYGNGGGGNSPCPNDTTRPEPTADAVERAAEAIYVTNQASAIPRDKRWWITPFEEIVVDAQERYRDMARAALQAAAKGAEGDE